MIVDENIKKNFYLTNEITLLLDEILSKTTNREFLEAMTTYLAIYIKSMCEEYGEDETAICDTFPFMLKSRIDFLKKFVNDEKKEEKNEIPV